MKGLPIHSLLFLVALAGPAAHAEVTAQSPAAFTIAHRAEVPAPPERVFGAIGEIGRWWNGAHTYSGSAANLRLDMEAGGCFCECWDGGSVEHARVLYVGRGPGERDQKEHRVDRQALHFHAPITPPITVSVSTW